ncbi:MAG: glycosyltransferase [Chloroflexota bacterium]|nr:glycosyltransferase [Chloroflexota bacterium]
MTEPSPAGPNPRVSVVMPTFKHAPFVPRAIESLLGQTFAAWELIVVDDGSPDETRAAVAPFLDDSRVRYRRLEENRGLGHALNAGLADARADYVAYLPSDDLYHREHLSSLVAHLDGAPGAVLAFSGVRYRYNRYAIGQIEGEPLQLAQVLHRRTPDRWLERNELTTDDLDRMLWAKLRERGAFVPTGRATCEWVDHPDQRHKRIREGETGGLNAYRVYHNASQPLRFRSSIGSPIDEVERYRRFRERPPTPPAPAGLKILLVGELAYNPERMLALEERGHRLYGLWTPTPSGFNTVGPLPFGHVEDLPRAGWREAVRRLKPDVIYALLNWQAVPFAHHVLTENPGVPFVWHFKEGPFICLQKGTWPMLADLHRRAGGRIYTSPELRDWFAGAVPGHADDRPTLALDGDLPKREWFDAPASPRLSAADGEVHTVVPGRPIGLHPETVGELARAGVHLHFYGDFFHGLWRGWIERATSFAPDHLHLHPQVDQDGWVTEFSRYDAGWLHFFESRNGGELRRADWDDLNYPARIATLVAAGLPLLQRDNAGAAVATQTLARDLDIGLFSTTMDEMAAQLRDGARMDRLRANVRRHRDAFTFDHHADRLVAFFHRVIDARG